MNKKVSLILLSTILCSQSTKCIFGFGKKAEPTKLEKALNLGGTVLKGAGNGLRHPRLNPKKAAALYGAATVVAGYGIYANWDKLTKENLYNKPVKAIKENGKKAGEAIASHYLMTGAGVVGLAGTIYAAKKGGYLTTSAIKNGATSVLNFVSSWTPKFIKNHSYITGGTVAVLGTAIAAKKVMDSKKGVEADKVETSKVDNSAKIAQLKAEINSLNAEKAQLNSIDATKRYSKQKNEAVAGTNRYNWLFNVNRVNAALAQKQTELAQLA